MRRVMVLLSVLLIAALMAPAVFAGGQEEDAEVDELEFWGFADNRNQWYADVAEDFEADTGVSINFQSMPYDEMHDQVQIALVSGTGAPDMADIEISQFSTYVKGDRVGFVSLNQYLDDETLDSLYAPAALAPWTWEGEHYGIGNELNPTFMYYRWDLFEDAGIDTPIETWEEFTEAGEQYVEETGKMFTTVGGEMWELWWMMAMDDGGFFDADGNIVFDNELGRRVLQMQYDWLYEHEIASLAPGGGTTEPEFYGALGAGDYAAVFGPPWYQGFLKDNVADLEGNWRIQQMPVYEDGMGSPTGSWGGTGTVITEQSNAPDIAWDFISFANFNVDNLMMAFDRFNLFPTWQPIWDDDALYEPDPYFDNQAPGEWVDRYADQIPDWNNSPFWPEITEFFENNVVNAVMLDDVSLDQALEQGVPRAEELMEDF